MGRVMLALIGPLHDEAGPTDRAGYTLANRGTSESCLETAGRAETGPREPPIRTFPAQGHSQPAFPSDDDSVDQASRSIRTFRGRRLSSLQSIEGCTRRLPYSCVRSPNWMGYRANRLVADAELAGKQTQAAVASSGADRGLLLGRELPPLRRVVGSAPRAAGHAAGRKRGDADRVGAGVTVTRRRERRPSLPPSHQLTH
jgi:hypothetical protein